MTMYLKSVLRKCVAAVGKENVAPLEKPKLTATERNFVRKLHGDELGVFYRGLMRRKQGEGLTVKQHTKVMANK